MGEVLVIKRVKDYLFSLPKNEQIRMMNMLEIFLEDDNAKLVSGYSNLYRLKIGDRRIIYTIDNGNYMVIAIG